MWSSSLIRKGYVEQQVEGLALALARLLHLPNLPVKDRLFEIDRLCRTRTGMDLATWARLAGLSRPGEDGVAVLTAARLMTEASLREPERRGFWVTRAVLLASEAVHSTPELADSGAREWLETIRTAVLDQDRSPAVRRALAYLEESLGHLTAAEAEWMEQEEEGLPWAREERRHLYLRLLELPDDMLNRGGLPREEILEMLSLCEGD